MKKSFLFVILSLLCTTYIFAQSPQKINYQAVVKDNNGDTVNSQNISIQININQSSPSGTTVYTETHAVTTSDGGLVALLIGDGATTDDFSMISWGSATYFLNVAVDLNAGSNYTSLGTQQLVSVPYALHANSSDKLAANTSGTININDTYNFPTTDGNNGQVLSTNGAGNLTWRNQNATIQYPITSTGGNLFVGNNAGTNADPTFAGNVLIGPRAGRDLTTNIDNTMIGNGAGETNTGDRNTFVGISTGQNNKGSNNIFIGYRAGKDNVFGSNNIFIGSNTGNNESGSNKLYVDISSTANPLIFGDFNTDALKVNGTLEVTSNTTVSGTLKIGSSTALTGIYKVAVSKNVGNIGGNSSRIETFTVTGASPGDVVYVSPSENLQSQVVIAQCWVSSNNTVSVRFRNTDGGSQDPDSGNGATYYITVIK